MKVREQRKIESEIAVIRGKMLFVEDDEETRQLVRAAFDGTGIEVEESETGALGMEMCRSLMPDLILLDLGLPDVDGTEFVREFRQWSNVPIIILSAQGQDQIKIACLEAGADDYVTKPFSVSELIARVRAAIRRASTITQSGPPTVFESGPLRVDLMARDTFLNGERLHLTPLEYKLLSIFIKNAGRVVTHRQLLTEVWGSDFANHSQYLRVYISYLRQKLKSTSDETSAIVNEPGVGYRFVP